MFSNCTMDVFTFCTSFQLRNLFGNPQVCFYNACKKQVTDEGLSEKIKKSINTSSGYTPSPLGQRFGDENRADWANCWAAAPTIGTGSSRGASQLPKVPAATHVDMPGGVFLAPRSRSPSTEDISHHTVSGGSYLLHPCAVGLPQPPDLAGRGLAAATSTVLSPHRECTAKIQLNFPVCQRAKTQRDPHRVQDSQNTV